MQVLAKKISKKKSKMDQNSNEGPASKSAIRHSKVPIGTFEVRIGTNSGPGLRTLGLG